MIGQNLNWVRKKKKNEPMPARIFSEINVTSQVSLNNERLLQSDVD